MLDQRRALRWVIGHRRQGPTPDVVRYADLLAAADDLVRTGVLLEPLALPEPYPFPKKRGGSRVLALVPPLADARFLSAVCALIPAIEDRLLPFVYSHRWRPSADGPTEPFQIAMRRMEKDLVRAHRDGLSFWQKLDARDFYGAIRRDVLTRHLDDLEAPEAARLIILSFFQATQSAAEGLPQSSIGSDLLANSLLWRLDHELAANPKLVVARYVDDVMGLARESEDLDDMAMWTNVHFTLLNLDSNDDKNERLDGIRALGAIRDAFKNLLKYVAFRETAVTQAIEAFVLERIAKEEQLPEDDLAHAIRMATRARSDMLHGYCIARVSRLGFAGVPLGDYLRVVPPGPKYDDFLFDAAGSPYSARFEVTRLSLLRFFVGRPRGGSAEAGLFLGVAANHEVPVLNRSWAAFAGMLISPRRIRRELVAAVADGAFPETVARGVVAGSFVRQGRITRQDRKAFGARSDLRLLVAYLDDRNPSPSEFI